MFADKLQEAFDALELADNEDISQKDTRPLMKLCSKIASTTARLSGLINVRRTALASFNYVLEGDDVSDEITKETLKRLKKLIRLLIRNSVNTALYGEIAFKLESELFADTKNNSRIYKISKIYKPWETVKYDNKLYTYNEDAKVRIDDDQNILFLLDDSDYDGGIMRSVLTSQILLYMNTEEWMNTNKLLKGLITGTLDSEKLRQAQVDLKLSESQIEGIINAFDSAIAKAGDYSAFRTISAFDIDLKSLSQSGASASFDLFEKNKHADISISIIGQADITQLSSHGSYAGLKVQDLVRQDILYADMINASEIVQQLLDKDYRDNYDTNSDSPLELKFIFDENGDIEATINKYENAFRNGVPVSKKAYYDEMGLKQPLTNEDTLQSTQELL